MSFTYIDDEKPIMPTPSSVAKDAAFTYLDDNPSSGFQYVDDLAAPAVDPLAARPSSAQATPRQGLPIPESTHPGDVAFKEKLAADALAKAEKESAVAAGARRAAFRVAPLVAGLAGGAAGGKGGALAGAAIGTAIAPGPGTAIGAGIGGVAGGLLGGGAAAIAARKGQDVLLENVAPEQMAQWQAEMQAAEKVHPVASFVGDMAPQLIGLKPSFKNVASAFRGARALLSGADDVIASPAGRAMMEQLANVGIGAGVEGAQEAYEQYKAGDFNAGRLLARVATAAIINEPNRFGVRLGIRPSTGEVEIVAPVEPKAEVPWGVMDVAGNIRSEMHRRNVFDVDSGGRWADAQQSVEADGRLERIRQAQEDAQMSPRQIAERDAQPTMDYDTGEGIGQLESGHEPTPIRGPDNKPRLPKVRIDDTPAVGETQEESAYRLANERGMSLIGQVENAVADSNSRWNPNHPLNLQKLTRDIMRPSLEHPNGLSEEAAAQIVAKLPKDTRQRLLMAMDELPEPETPNAPRPPDAPQPTPPEAVPTAEAAARPVPPEQAAPEPGAGVAGDGVGEGAIDTTLPPTAKPEAPDVSPRTVEGVSSETAGRSTGKTPGSYPGEGGSIPPPATTPAKYTGTIKYRMTPKQFAAQSYKDLLAMAKGNKYADGTTVYDAIGATKPSKTQLVRQLKDHRNTYMAVERSAKTAKSAKEKMQTQAARPLTAKSIDTTGDMFDRGSADNPLFAPPPPKPRADDTPFQTTTRPTVRGTSLPEHRANTGTMMKPLGGTWTEGKSDGHIGTWTDGKGTTIDFRHGGVDSPTTGPQAGETAMGMTQRTGRGKYTVTIDAKTGDITTPPHELAEIIGMAARGGMSEPYHRVVKKAIGIDLSTPEGAHKFAVQMETPEGRNRIADALLKAAPGAQQGFRRWINNLIRMANRLLGTNVKEFIDPDFKKLANGMRDFTALKQLASIDATRVDAYQTRQPTGNADYDDAAAIFDRMEETAAAKLREKKLPLFRRVRDFVGRNIATVNAPVNTRRAELGRQSDVLWTLAEKSYIYQQAQQSASSHALKRFTAMTDAWKAKGITSDDVPELGKYMSAKRIVELYDRGEGIKSPMTREQAQAFVDVTEAGPKGQRMKDAAAEAAKAFDDSLKALLESGTISQQQYDNIKAKNKFYFPRAFLDHIDPPTGAIEKTKMGDVQVRQSGVRHIMEGSEGDLLTDPLMLIAQNIAHAETVAAKNRSHNALLDLADAATPAQRASTDFDIQQIPWQRRARNGYEKIEFWRGGEKKALEVRSDLATALKMLDPAITADTARLLRLASGTSLVKFMATSGNPEFGIGNFFRDLGLHYLASGEYSPVLPVAMAQQIKQAAKLTMSRALKQKLRDAYSKYGGGSERLSTSDFQPDALNSRTYKHTKSVMQSVLGAMGYVGNKSEELSRLMLMNQALQKMGKTVDTANADELMKAVSVAKEIINFHDYGKIIKALDTIIPFLNPSFQGGRSIMRAFKTRPVETTAKAAQIVAAGALMAAWNRKNDDKAWESVSESDKSTKFIICMNAAQKDKDGVERYGYLGIPVDQAWRPFLIFGQMIADKLAGKEVNTELLRKSIRANYVPMDFQNMPPVMAAALTYGQNHDFWTGDKVWKGRDVEPEMEQKASTPVAAVKIGEATGMSPERLRAASKKLLPQNPLTTLAGWGAEMFDNDPARRMRESNLVSLSNMPGVRRIFRVTSPRELREDDIKAARRLRIDSRGKSAAQVLNEVEKAEKKQNTYRQANDTKFDRMIAQVKSGAMTKADLLREVQKTKDANGRADMKEIARIRRRLHERYPALNIPAPRSSKEIARIRRRLHERYPALNIPAPRSSND